MEKKGSIREKTHLKRSADGAFPLDEKAHLPLAVRRGARGKLASRLGSHDGGGLQRMAG